MLLPGLVAEVLTCQSIQLPDAKHKYVPPVTRVGKTNAAKKNKNLQLPSFLCALTLSIKT